MQDGIIVTTIRITPATRRILNELALLRAERLGLRPSASAVIGELVQAESSRLAENPK